MAPSTADPSAGDCTQGLVLLRHGESSANAAGRFTGRWDVDLTVTGERQAATAAGLLEQVAFTPGVVFSSPLTRSLRTAQIVLDLLFAQQRRPSLDVEEALTERGYGVLTGLRKDRAREEFGTDQTRQWRRSLTSRPPTRTELLENVSQQHPGEGNSWSEHLERVQPDSRVPGWDGTATLGPPVGATEISETLVEVVSRVRQWFEETLSPVLALQVPLLVVAHGNSLRALTMLLDDLSEEQVKALNIPTGHPLHYDVAHGEVITGSGRYLDPVAAGAAAQAVAREGGT